MTNNDILRRVRYSLDLKDAQSLALFAQGGVELDEAQFRALFAKEEDENYHSCSNEQLLGFLDGLVLQERGPREGGPAPKAEGAEPMNNQVFKKLRVALQLKEDDILSLLALAGFIVRNPFLRNFLQGLALQRRHGAEPNTEQDTDVTAE